LPYEKRVDERRSVVRRYLVRSDVHVLTNAGRMTEASEPVGIDCTGANFDVYSLKDEERVDTRDFEGT